MCQKNVITSYTNFCCTRYTRGHSRSTRRTSSSTTTSSPSSQEPSSSITSSTTSRLLGSLNLHYTPLCLRCCSSIDCCCSLLVCLVDASFYHYSHALQFSATCMSFYHYSHALQFSTACMSFYHYSRALQFSTACMSFCHYSHTRPSVFHCLLEFLPLLAHAPFSFPLPA